MGNTVKKKKLSETKKKATKNILPVAFSEIELEEITENKQSRPKNLFESVMKRNYSLFRVVNISRDTVQSLKDTFITKLTETTPMQGNITTTKTVDSLYLDSVFEHYESKKSDPQELIELNLIFNDYYGEQQVPNQHIIIEKKENHETHFLSAQPQPLNVKSENSKSETAVAVLGIMAGKTNATLYKDKLDVATTDAKESFYEAIFLQAIYDEQFKRNTNGTLQLEKGTLSLAQLPEDDKLKKETLEHLAQFKIKYPFVEIELDTLSQFERDNFTQLVNELSKINSNDLKFNQKIPETSSAQDAEATHTDSQVEKDELDILQEILNEELKVAPSASSISESELSTQTREDVEPFEEPTSFVDKSTDDLAEVLEKIQILLNIAKSAEYEKAEKIRKKFNLVAGEEDARVDKIQLPINIINNELSEILSEVRTDDFSIKKISESATSNIEELETYKALLFSISMSRQEIKDLLKKESIVDLNKFLSNTISDYKAFIKGKSVNDELSRNQINSFADQLLTKQKAEALANIKNLAINIISYHQSYLFFVNHADSENDKFSQSVADLSKKRINELQAILNKDNLAWLQKEENQGIMNDLLYVLKNEEQVIQSLRKFDEAFYNTNGPNNVAILSVGQFKIATQYKATTLQATKTFTSDIQGYFLKNKSKKTDIITCLRQLEHLTKTTETLVKFRKNETGLKNLDSRISEHKKAANDLPHGRFGIKTAIEKGMNHYLLKAKALCDAKIHVLPQQAKLFSMSKQPEEVVKKVKEKKERLKKVNDLGMLQDEPPETMRRKAKNSKPEGKYVGTFEDILKSLGEEGTIEDLQLMQELQDLENSKAKPGSPINEQPEADQTFEDILKSLGEEGTIDDPQLMKELQDLEDLKAKPVKPANEQPGADQNFDDLLKNLGEEEIIDDPQLMKELQDLENLKAKPERPINEQSRVDEILEDGSGTVTKEKIINNLVHPKDFQKLEKEDIKVSSELPQTVRKRVKRSISESKPTNNISDTFDSFTHEAQILTPVSPKIENDMSLLTSNQGVTAPSTVFGNTPAANHPSQTQVDTANNFPLKVTIDDTNSTPHVYSAATVFFNPEFMSTGKLQSSYTEDAPRAE